MRPYPFPSGPGSRRQWLRSISHGLLATSVGMGLTGCGFHLRRSTQLPFHSLYTNLAPNGSIGLALRREISHSEGTVLVNNPKKADIRLMVVQELPEREVVAYSSEGRAREYELRLHLRFYVVDAKGDDLIPESEITLRREISNADNQLTARADEEAILFKDMSNDMAHQLIWRLSAIQTVN
ncbi:MAG: LPS assembly lipoprotein LptE [Lautropia sp.]|nr:LPS assembly lipoprotein LptE [Lautropia sp.]